MKAEAHAGQDHEGDDDELYGEAVEGGDPRIPGTEPPSGHGGEGVADRVEGGHTGEHEQKKLGARDDHVREPQLPGQDLETGDELVEEVSSGDLGPEEAEGPAECGEDRDEEQDDPHPAEPLDEAAPQQVGVVHALHVRDHGRAGRGKPAHGLEEGVGVTRDVPGQIEGDGGQGRDEEPRGDNHPHGLEGLQPPGPLGHSEGPENNDQHEGGPEDENEGGRDLEHLAGRLDDEDGQDRQEKGEREDQEDPGEDQPGEHNQQLHFQGDFSSRSFNLLRPDRVVARKRRSPSSITVSPQGMM